MLDFISNKLEERKQKISAINPTIKQISDEFLAVANLHNFKYAEDLRMLCVFLQYELYQKVPDNQMSPNLKKEFEDMLKTKQELINKFTETSDDQLVNAAIQRLPKQGISLKKLVDEF